MPATHFSGDFADFATQFKAGLQVHGDYWNHIKSAWKLKEEPGLKFLWFEDMKADQRPAIEELCRFLEHPLTPTQVDSLLDHVSFDNMKKNPAANPTAGIKLLNDGSFMRKGKVGVLIEKCIYIPYKAS